MTAAGISKSTVPPSDTPDLRNLLLKSLAPGDLDFIRGHLTPMVFKNGDALLELAGPLHYVHFPEAGIVSIHDIITDGTRIGVGIVGLEGLVGWASLLGCSYSPHEASVAIGPVTTHSIRVEDLASACWQRPELNALLLRYVQVFMNQMGRTILSNLRDSVDRRLARWLLMNRDRLETDEIALTHEQLGVMLGVRRATVTDTLHVLEGDGLVRSTRGRIIIRDRDGLRDRAGEAYGAAEETYKMLIAASPSTAA